jgi:uncharacterized RDD family membrane protein YckC
MTEKKIESGTRLSSMLLDHFIMTMIAVLFFIPEMISTFTNAFTITHEQPQTEILGRMTYIYLIGFAIYFCKDCINGRSIAKRILKLQIVDNLTGQVASPMKCLLRNVFCVLWPLEVVVALNNPSRRIGDRVAGTKLVYFDSSLEQPKVNFGKVAITLLIAYSFMVLLMIPLMSMQPKFVENKTKFVESSYNIQTSKSTEKLFNDSMGQILTADIKVYDRIETENLKYVSAIFILKKDYLESDSDFEKLKAETTRFILTQFHEKTFVGKLEYVYQTSTSMTSKMIYFDWRQTNDKKGSR